MAFNQLNVALDTTTMVVLGLCIDGAIDPERAVRPAADIIGIDHSLAFDEIAASVLDPHTGTDLLDSQHHSPVGTMSKIPADERMPRLVMASQTAAPLGPHLSAVPLWSCRLAWCSSLRATTIAGLGREDQATRVGRLMRGSSPIEAMLSSVM